MSAIPIVCTNCGAKYKLPETFKSDKAKCKKCGAVIDVRAQMPAAAADAPEPEPAPVAAADDEPTRPVRRVAEEKTRPVRRSREKQAEAEPAKASAKAKPAAARAKPARASRSAGSDSGKPSRRSSGTRSGRASGRRGARGDEEKKKSKLGMILGIGGGVLAIVIVALIFVMSGSDDPTEQGAAQTDPNAATPQNPENPGDQVTEPVEAAAKPGEGDPAAASATGDEPGKDEPDPAEKPAEKPPEKPAKPELQSAEDVYNPKEEFEPLEYPEELDPELVTEIEKCVQAVVDGGVRGARSKTRLKEIGFGAAFGIINALRELDYMDPYESASAFELNKLLEEMVRGFNAGYRPPADYTAPIPLEDADWNAKTSKMWRGLVLVTAPTQEKWDKLVQSRSKGR